MNANQIKEALYIRRNQIQRVLNETQIPMDEKPSRDDNWKKVQNIYDVLSGRGTPLAPDLRTTRR